MKLAPVIVTDICVIVCRLKLNRDREMQSACVKALIVTNNCGLSSIVKADTVRRVLLNCLKMDSWLRKQSESIDVNIDILGAIV
jgi:hypothetical protein